MAVRGEFGLRGVHVVITGGSKGVGAALAHELSSRGARLTLIARPSAELDTTAKELDAVPLETDLSDPGALVGLVERAERQNGPLDILINNAALARTGPFVERTDADVQAQLSANLLAPMLLTRQALPGLIARGRGRILNVSSISGETSVPNSAGYSASKAALTTFTACVQAELRRQSAVAVLLLVLGKVGETAMVKEFDRDPVGAAISRTLGRMPYMGLEQAARKIVDNLGSSDPKRITALPNTIAPLVLSRLAAGRALNRALRLPPTQ